MDTLDKQEMKFVAVLAGTHQQFSHYENIKEDDEKFIYVHSPQKLYGYRFSRVDIIGTFWERKDAGQLYEEVERHFPHLID